MVKYCGMCPDLCFTTQAEYNLHIQNHEESQPAAYACAVCPFTFPDSLALEQHKINSGHGSPRFSCSNCGEEFVTHRGLDQHMRPPGCSRPVARAAASSSESSLPLRPAHSPHHLPRHPAKPGPPIACDRCLKTFSTRQEFDKHRSYKANTPCSDHNRKTPVTNRVGYVDPDKPMDDTALQTVLGYGSSSEVDVSDSDTPSDMTDDATYCTACKTKFVSLAQLNAHYLRCVTKDDVAKVPKAKVPKQMPVAKKSSEAIQPSRSSVKQEQIRGPAIAPKASVKAPGRPSPSPSSAPSATGEFRCTAQGCTKAFRSEPALKVHRQDNHGIGGRAVDLMGKDSWMLNQTSRNKLKQEGLLRAAPSGPSGGRGSGGRAPPASTRPPPSRPMIPYVAAPPQIPAFRPLPQTPAPVPTSHNMGGAYEIEQAKQIQGKILRLLIQSDIFIHHDGRITVCGVDWTRIGVQKQPEVVGMFDGMCHLKKYLQGEYLPPPKAFRSDYQVPYPTSEFTPSPPHDRFKPGLGVVAIACTKVVLPDGLREVVKIAAIDVITCRILMNHLVCTDGHMEVANWRFAETGLFRWDDMEQARTLGYKVFRGWSAVRSALYKVIDDQTIIVGHNLRSDLDSLRMIHGRAVDIAKLAEFRANGPLSKSQLALDSLCHNYPTVSLKPDPEYGRDVLMNAFAIREMGLWVIKNKEKFEKDIRQKSRDYALVMPRAAAA